MTRGLVSVIIPTYDRARLVGAAIESALAQGDRDLEVIVIDDGSKDGTRETLTRAYGSNPKVRLLSKANGGVSSARNLGIRESRGEFIAFLDADDVWLPGKLALQLECLRRFPEAGMIWTDMSAVDAEGRVLHERYLRRMYSAYEFYPASRDLFADGLKESRIGGVTAYCGDIFSPMVLGNLVHTSTALLRRERLDKVGFFNEDYKTGEDYPFHLKTCREGPVAFADAATVRYAVGLADALTSPDKLIQISLNYLSTFERTLALERGRISLSPALIREQLSNAYAWVGQEHLNAGLSREARSYFLKSLRTNPKDLSRLKPALASLLPSGVRARVAGFKRGLRARFRK
jgi:glycosyltransferase involved in cell wall biosynthesis